MNSILLTGLAVSCAGALCALAGDIQKRAGLGLVCFLLLNLAIWARFFVHIFSPMALLEAVELFLLSHALATCAYLGMAWFLDPVRKAYPQAALSARD